MVARAHPRLLGYGAATAALVLMGVALASPAVVALAAPFAVWLAVGAALVRRPRLSAEVALEPSRSAEGQEIVCRAEFRSADAPWLELELPVPAGITSSTGPLRLRVRGDRRAELRVRCGRWGAYRLGPVRALAQDALGLFTYEADLGRALPLRVYPAWSRLRELVPPRRTQVFFGNRIARQSGDGIEFSEVRQFFPGDLVRRINWRVTARTGVPHV
ncbi:MAG: DUF58 domain-containing protein, partial [Candidatus Dormibacteria bacterium]